MTEPVLVFERLAAGFYAVGPEDKQSAFKYSPEPVLALYEAVSRPGRCIDVSHLASPTAGLLRRRERAWKRLRDCITALEHAAPDLARVLRPRLTLVTESGQLALIYLPGGRGPTIGAGVERELSGKTCNAV